MAEFRLYPFPNKPWFLCLQYKSFENTERNREIARHEQFLLFPQCFLPFLRTFHHFHQIWKCHLQTLSFRKSLKCVIWEKGNPFPKWQILDFSKLKEFADDNFEFDQNGRKFFQWVENTVEKLLVTTNFSFSHIVFKRLVLHTHKN